jgi:plastocyanin
MRLSWRSTAILVALATLGLAAPASAVPAHRNIQILDDCEPASFNAVLGEGACVKDGEVTFDEFIGQLLSMGEAPAWRFSPERAAVRAGGTVTAWNRGGEFHTFTEVAAFGGGCVEELNQLLGLTAVPECANAGQLFATTGVPPRGSRTTGALATGPHRFMCIIHPWQRTTVKAG